MAVAFRMVERVAFTVGPGKVREGAGAMAPKLARYGVGDAALLRTGSYSA